MSCVVRICIALGAVLAVVLCCDATTVDSGGDDNVVYSKIGFHLGPGGDQDNIVTFMTELDKARIPFFIKSVDAYGTIAQGVALRQASGVDHTLVWRNTNLDVPDYSLPPAQAADKHWNATMAQMPTGFAKSEVWLELINEPDESKCQWLGEFGVQCAANALRDGYNISMFSFATGNPPVESANPGDGCWQTQGMLDYLKLAEAHPDQLAVALHEYSLTTKTIFAEYPYLVGRFQFLFDACDAHHIARPKVHITEWGWEAFATPGPATAVANVDAVMTRAYAKYPQLVGGAIWFLGPGFHGIAQQADKIVLPLLNFTLHTTWPSAGDDAPTHTSSP